MSKETAKKLIAELQTNEELQAKIAGIKDKDELVKIAVQNGYDVTVEEMLEAEKEFRAEMAQKSDELSAEELEGAAGGSAWTSEEDPDGNEYGCAICNLKYDDQKEYGDWCKKSHYCDKNNLPEHPPIDYEEIKRIRNRRRCDLGIC